MAQRDGVSAQNRPQADAAQSVNRSAPQWGPWGWLGSAALAGPSVQPESAWPWLKPPEWLTSASDSTATASSPLNFDLERLQTVRQQYVHDLQQLASGVAASAVTGDRRFASELWRRNPLSGYAVAAYQAHARALLGLADALEVDAKQRTRIRFAVQQFTDALAPSNFLALNPEALQKALDTKGQSLTRGLHNLLQDLGRGHLLQTDETVFEVGRNLAITEGAVVYENDFFQLIEYKPLTERVHERPLLIVPPCINKYYILDLQPESSLVRYAVEQGMHTFLISWRNPDESMAQAGWDDYVEQAVIRAIDVTRTISGQNKRGGKINALGFCVGGTLLGTALAVLAARGKKPLASVTLLTTFLDFEDTGILDIFVDEASVQLRELQFAQGGLLPGQELASTFSFLRPNELVWNYVVGNYLKGETPPPFDLLYWNSDVTHLPGPFYAWYLRQTYLENNLAQPRRIKVCGVPVDFTRLDLPAYVYGSREDHIVPVASAYASTRHLQGPTRFVMGASGHIAGVINPPSKGKRSFWSWQSEPEGGLPERWADWQAQAQETPGSWWPDWSHWLKAHAGKSIAAPLDYGSAQYPVIEPAPGRYVRAKA
jgi:polyhydroxyalkanoate synthase